MFGESKERKVEMIVLQIGKDLERWRECCKKIVGSSRVRKHFSQKSRGLELYSQGCPEAWKHRRMVVFYQVCTDA